MHAEANDPSVDSLSPDTPTESAAEGESTRQPAGDPQVSDSLICGRYRRIEFLGEGALGRVWRCFDQVAGIEVAIKALPPALARDAAMVAAIRSNFQAVERLHHPHIVAAKTLEVDSDSRECYLIMAYVEGTDLNHLLARRGGQMSMAEVVRIARQVAAALDFCHLQNLIHRDIKPSNILMDSSGCAQVLDFGLAAEFESTIPGVWDEAESEAVKTGGTLGFMPPEQWKGLHMDGRTDQYALAATVYKLLSGRAPFAGAPNMAALMRAVEQEPVPPIDGVGDAVWQVLEKALSKDRKGRYTTCSEFVDALEAAVTPAGSHRAIPWPLVIPGVVAVLLTAAGLALFGRRLQPTTSGMSLPPAGAPGLSAGLRYHGLVVGIDDYPDGGGWRDLVNARGDAEDVAALLQTHYGFDDVVRVMDREATRKRILQEIETLALATGPRDAILIFFAGHGEYAPDPDEGYWIPADAGGGDASHQDRSGWVQNLEVTALLEASDARHALVIADSCYAGALVSQSVAGVEAGEAHGSTPYQRLLDRSSRHVIASGEYWEKVYDTGSGNGPFVDCLLRTLGSNTNRWLSVGDLVAAIRVPYHERTGNTLRAGPLLRADRGQFVFERVGSSASPTLALTEDPEPVLSGHPLTELALLTRSGATNAAERLRRKLPPDIQIRGLAASLTDYFDAAAQRERIRELQELAAYVRGRAAESGPRLEDVLQDYARPRVVVVVGPDDRSQTQVGAIEETIWRSGLTEALRSAGGVRVVDRRSLGDLLVELELSDARLSDERVRSLVGRLLPASLLVTGQRFSEGKSSRVFLRLLATESTEVLGVFDVTVERPQGLKELVEETAKRIHIRVLETRPLQARLLRIDGNRAQAAAGRFHGVRPNSRFELVQRIREEGDVFGGSREIRVGTASVQHLGENTSELEPAWETSVPSEELDTLWVRELPAPMGA